MLTIFITSIWLSFNPWSWYHFSCAFTARKPTINVTMPWEMLQRRIRFAAISAASRLARMPAASLASAPRSGPPA